MELQHINVKLPVQDPEEVDLEPLIPIFHRWIQDQVCEELLLDVADYRHVYAGPGLVLIGHEANYSLDNTDGRLGIRYNRKAAVEGSNLDRLIQATQAALNACRRLEEDPRLGGMIRFNGRELEVSINDRLLAPNSTETRQAVDVEFQSYFQGLLEKSDYTLWYAPDPRSLFSVGVKTSRRFSAAELLNNLNSFASAPQQALALACASSV